MGPFRRPTKSAIRRFGATRNPGGARLPSRCRRRKGLVATIVVAAICVAAGARAQDSVAEAVAWLEAHQNADGSWGQNGSDQLRATSRALEALRSADAMGASYSAGVAWLADAVVLNDDSAARKLATMLSVGGSSGGLGAILLSHARPEGGWGFDGGHYRDLLTSALAVKALRAWGATGASEFVLGRSSVRLAQASGGYWAWADGDPSVYLSALCLGALLEDPASQAAISSGIGWLLSHQNPDGGFGLEGSTAYETALALLLLLEVQSGTSARIQARQYLEDSQETDGSWGHDAYCTAMATKALARATLPNLRIEESDMATQPVTIYEGDTVQVTVRVWNTGDQAATGVPVQLFVDNEAVGATQFIPCIAPLDAESTLFVWLPDSIVGYRELHAWVDSSEVIRETDETDNDASRQVFVVDTTPPSPDSVYVSSDFLSPNGDGIQDETRLYFELPDYAVVSLRVTTDAGTEVRVLATSVSLGPGLHAYAWDGTAENGEVVVDGVYRFELSTSSGQGAVGGATLDVVVDNNRSPLIPDLVSGDFVALQYTSGSTPWYPVWSPSGDRIAYLQGWPCYPFTMDANGQNHRQLSPTGVINSVPPTWSPDGRYIAVCRGTYPEHDIWKIDTASGGEWRLTNSASSGLTYYNPSWSPDGELIAHEAFTDSGYCHVWTMSPTGSGASLLVADGLCPTWSPGGDQVLYQKAYYRWIHWYQAYEALGLELFSLPRAGGVPHYLCDAGQFPYVSPELCWIPGMNRFFYTQVQSGFGGPWIVESTSVRCIGLDGTNDLLVMDAATQAAYPGSGQWVAFLLNEWVNSNEPRLWVKNTDTGHLAKIALPDIVSILDGFSPDGSRLLLTAAWSGSQQIHALASTNNLIADITQVARTAQNPGAFTIRGTASDAYLDQYQLFFGEGDDPSVFYPAGAPCHDRVVEGDLGVWVPPGPGTYTIRLVCRDRAGNTASDRLAVQWVEDTRIAGIYAYPGLFSPNGDGALDTCGVWYTALEAGTFEFRITDAGGAPVWSAIHTLDGPADSSFSWSGETGLGVPVPDGQYALQIDDAQIQLETDTVAPVVELAVVSEARLRLSARDPHLYRWWLEWYDATPCEGESHWKVYRGGWYEADNVEYQVDAPAGPIEFLLWALDRAGNADTVFCTMTISGEGQCVSGVSILAPRDEEVLVAWPGRMVNVRAKATSCGPTPNRPVTIRFTERADTSSAWQFIDEVRMIGDCAETDWPIEGLSPGFHILRAEALDREGGLFGSATIRVSINTGIWLNVQPWSVFAGDHEVEALYGGGTDPLLYATFQYRSYPDATQPWMPIGDAVTGEPYAVMWDTRTVDDGYWVLSVEGRSAAGGDLFHAVPIQIANCPPYALLTSPLPGWVVDGPVQLAANAYATEGCGGEGSAVMAVAFEKKVSATEWDTLAVAIARPYEAVWDALAEPEGALTIRAKAEDSYYRYGVSPQAIVVVDHTDPTATITAPAMGTPLSGAPIAVQGTATDVHFSHYVLEVGAGAAPSAWSLVASSGTAVSSGTLGVWHAEAFPSGDYTIRLEASDKAGRVAADSVTVTLSNADIKPLAILMEPPPGAWIAGQTQVIGTAFSPALDFYIVEHGIGPAPGSWTLITTDSVSVQHGVLATWNSNSVAEGVYTLRLSVSDTGGVSARDSVFLGVDNQAPVAALTAPSPGSLLVAAAAVEGTASDSHLSSYKVLCGQGTIPQGWTLVCQGASSVVAGELGTWWPLPPDGEHTLRLAVTDSAGNETADTITVLTNGWPPAAPPRPSATAAGLFVTLTWSPNSEGDVVGYHVYRDDVCQTGSPTPAAAWVDTVPQSGTYSFSVAAMDSVGWESARSPQREVEVAVTVPTVAITHPVSGCGVRGPVTVTGTASSPELVRYWLEWAPGVAPADSDYVFVAESTVPVSLGQLAVWETSWIDTVCTLRLTAEDADGGAASCSLTVIADNTPPAAPTGLTAVPSGDDVALSWDANTDPVAGYLAYRDGFLVGAPESYEDALDYLILSASTTDADLGDGAYSYWVCAADSVGNVSQPSDTVQAVVETGAPSAWVAAPSDSARVAGEVLVKASSTDKDIASVSLEYAAQGTWAWSVIAVDSTPPYQTYWDAGSLVDGTYGLRAVATDSASHTDASPDSILVFVVDDASPPMTPVNLGAVVSGDTVSLNWNDNTEDDLDGYLVYRDGSLLTGSPIAASDYEDLFVDEGYHSYAVSAVDTAANESGKAAAMVLVDITPPFVDLTCPEEGAQVAGQVRIRAVILDDHLDRWEVWVGEGHPTADWDLLNSGTGGCDNDWGDTLTVALWDAGGRTGAWSFRVDVRDSAGTVVSDSTWCEIDDEPPAAPTGLVATATGAHTVDLTWDANTEPDLDHYKVYRADGPGAPFNPEVETWWIPHTSMGLEGGLVYAFAVTAIDSAGNESAFSPSDTALTADLGPPGAPTGLTATGGNLSVALSWEASEEPDVAGYHVLRDGSQVTTDSLRNPAYVDEGLTAGTSYQYRVTAVDWSGNGSAQSSPASATPWGVDLAIPDGGLAVYPEQLLPGMTARVAVSVCNLGTGPSPQAGLRLAAYSTDTLAVLVEGDVVPPLAPGDSVRIEADWFVGYETGSRHVVAMVDAADRVAETDERNNAAWLALEVQPSLIVLDTWTDSPTYWADQDVVLTAQVRNTGAVADTVVVRTSVQTAGGAVLALLEEALGAVAPGEMKQALLRWNTASTAPGSYVMRTRVMSSWEVRAEDTVSFTIRPNTGMEAWVLTDRISFLANDVVTLTCGAKNLSGNQGVDSLDARACVVRAGSDTVATFQWLIATLEPQGVHEVQKTWNTGTSTPGAYSVGFLVRDKEGELLVTATASFTIQGSDADSTYQLAGLIHAVPNRVEPDDSLVIHYQVHNLGNQAISSFTVLLGVVDVDAGVLQKSWTRSAGLGIGESLVDSLPADAAGLSWKPYMLWLGAVVGADTVSVASGALIISDLTGPAVVDASPDSGSFQRGDVTFAAHVTDNHDGVEQVTYRLDGGSWQALPRVSGTALDGLYQTVWHTTPANDGHRIWEIGAIDSAGNASASLVVPFILDNVAPVTQLSVTDTLYHDGTQSYAYEECGYLLAATDTLSGVEQILYSIDGAPSATYTDTLWLIGEGDHTLSYSAVDSAGNAETVDSLAVTVPPQIRLSFGGFGKLVSFPVAPEAGEIMDSIPEGSYVYRLIPGGSDFTLADSIVVGEGYWVLAPADTMIRWVGEPVGGFTYGAATGWNLIGSLFGPQDFTAPVTEPPGAMGGGCWHYDNAWVWSDSLLPRKGHYAAAFEDALLRVGTEAKGMIVVRAEREEPSWLIHLTLATRGGTATASCGVSPQGTPGIDRTVDRPVPAVLRPGDPELYFPVSGGVFTRLARDVRGPTDEWVWSARASADRPGTLAWDACGAPAGYRVRVTVDDVDASSGSGHTLLVPGEHAILVRVERADEAAVTVPEVDKAIVRPEGVLVWKSNEAAWAGREPEAGVMATPRSLSWAERAATPLNPFVVVANPERFVAELRSGMYRTAVLTGSADAVDSATVGELGLYARRGNRVIVFDEEGSLARALELVLGIEVSGGARRVGRIDIAENAWVAAGSWAMGALAPAVKVIDAEIVGADNGASVVTVRPCGRGHAIFVGSSLDAADPGLVSAVLGSALSASGSDPGARVVGVGIRVSGQGRAQVKERIADDIGLVDTGGGDVSGPTLSWYVDLTPQPLDLGYVGVLPDLRGRYRTTTEVRPLQGGVYRTAKVRQSDLVVTAEARDAAMHALASVAGDAALSSDAAAESRSTLGALVASPPQTRSALAAAISRLSKLSLLLEREPAGAPVQDALSDLAGIYATIWSYWAGEEAPR